ncbi:hypothetical protein GE09DRAFT_1060488 [Coniochaeta sp. 2T2.1]|nr:hypothetical protein GE09DRAFT_1060488 [Coniochaeta sp. 2T2.1]
MHFLLSPLLLLLSSSSLSSALTTHDPQTCTITGDPDLYGIGIRIGFYLAYLSGLCAVCFQNWAAVRDARKGVYTVNAAILVAMIRDTATQPANMAAFEWYILLQIAVFVPTSLSFVIRDEKPLTLALCCMVDATYAVLQPWVYFTRLGQGWDVDAGGGCPSPKVYIFAQIDFYSPPFTVFLKVMSVVSCVGGVFLFLCAFALLLFCCVPAVRRRHPDWTGIMMETMAEKKEGNFILSKRNAWTTGGLLFFGLTLIGLTEKTLAVNDISIPGTTVASTGQLIPLLVGILTTVSTGYTIATQPLPWTREHRMRYHSGGRVGGELEGDGGEVAGGEQQEDALGSVGLGGDKGPAKED